MSRSVFPMMLRPCGRRRQQVPSGLQSFHSTNNLVGERPEPSRSRNPMCKIKNSHLCSSQNFQSGPAASLAEDSLATAKDFSEIPGPKPWPILKNLVQFVTRKDFDMARAYITWDNIFKEYGPIVKLSFPGTPMIVASVNPDDLEVFMKSTLNNPIREGFQSIKMARDNAPGNYFNNKFGLIPENGEEWWRLRSRVQGPLLRPKNVSAYLPKVDRATLAYMDRIDLLQEETGRVPDDFLTDLYKWALECVGLVALNKELGCLDPNLAADSVPMRLINLISDLFSALNETEIGMRTWKLYRSSSYVKLETAHNSFVEVVEKAIQDAARDLAAANAEGDPDRELSIMETFMNTEGLSRGDVTTMILDMLLAGVDTTAHAVAFTLYLLATNPEAQEKLQQEVDSVLGDATELLPDHIAQMTYLNHVVKESLRIYPLVIGTSRVLTDDIVMSGFRVPAETLVLGFNMLICRDEKHFPQPNDFIPERWNRDRPYGPIHPFASLPFSHGKRMCIGKRIAEQEIYTFFTRVMQKYSVTFESQQQMEVKTQLVLKPNIPLPFKFHPRK